MIASRPAPRHALAVPDIIDMQERDGEGFYEDYAWACRELGVAPLVWPDLVALIEALVERPPQQ